VVEEIVTSSAIALVIDDAGEHARTATSGDAAPAGRIHMMTSGTTGRPKVAIHSLGSLLSRARGAAGFAGNREGKWLLTYQPTGFAGIQVILTATLTRGTIVVPEQRTPSGFWEAAKASNVQQISGTPTFWRSFLMVAKPGELPLRQITLGGEAADQVTLDRLKQSFPGARITHIYASTEAGVVYAVHDGREGFPAAWLEQSVQGVTLRIRDGLLQIKTPNAMHGYVSAASQPLLDDGFLATADRCEIEGDRVRVLGRQDSSINVGGSKVYPLAVEKFLLAQPGVLEARVFAVPNPVTGALVGAEVVIEPGSEPVQAKVSILAACRQGLASYQVPRVFKIVDAIEVRESGKKAAS
jgi:acyl-CoA synthetase (AMP-forming)/AMP-acid ligase II